jgi:hypothetical protein
MLPPTNRATRGGTVVRRPHWRKMTWVLVIWCALILLWAIAGAAGQNSRAYCLAHPSAYLSLKTCEAASNAGAGIGIAIILLIGFIGFVFFALIWIMSRPRRRDCPVCGESVKKGVTVCKKCGHDFAAAARGTTAPQPSP